MNNSREKIKNSILAFICIALFLSISYFRVFDEFEYNTLDLRFRIRADQSVDKEIVIIHIGDDTIDKLGEWPIPRRYHALLVRALHSAGVKDIIFDVFFSEPAKGDRVFAKAISETDNTYLPYIFEINLDNQGKSYLEATRVIAPIVKSLETVCKNTGFINVQPDIDGKVRRIFAFIEYNGKFYPHMAILAVLNEIGVSFKDVEVVPGKKIVIDKNRTIPLGEDSTILVNYPAKWGHAFNHYSYVDIIQSHAASFLGTESVIDLSELKDKVCFIGFTAAASPDAHPSPLEPLYPGVGVHASVYNSILRGDFLYRLSRWGNLFILIVMWLITGFITYKSHKSFAVISILLIISAYAASALALFCFTGMWIDIFYPLVTVVGVYVAITFRKYLMETRKREVIEKELDIAKDIQRSFLPTDIPHVGNLDIYANMLTAWQVGGDLYDVAQLDEDRLCVMLGDVSGKGVPAALFMAKVVSVFKTFVNQGKAEDIVRSMNDRLVVEGASSLFVTLACMIFNTKEKRVNFASGGHNPTLYLDADGKEEWLEVEDGMPLGILEGNYSGRTIEYRPESIFVLYTDGVTEAMNLKGDMYGEEKLLKLVKNMRTSSSKDIAEEIQNDVAEFAGKAKQHDDITVMVVRT
jgi:serine phosphatase RsbU (regulator of sigma subunit)/CHASE2 domain-containing sensor protein